MRSVDAVMSYGAAMASPRVVLEIAGHEVTVTNPERSTFRESGLTKRRPGPTTTWRVADGALRGVAGRPMALKRYVNGIDEPGFLPEAGAGQPARLDRDGRAEVPVRAQRPRDRAARRRPAGVGRQPRLHRPAPAPGPRRSTSSTPTSCGSTSTRSRACRGSDVRQVALVVGDVLDRLRPRRLAEDVRLARLPHLLPRSHRRWTFAQVRQAGIALAREVEQRVPDLATSRWWKEERHGVFIDYNQNAKDRTTAAAYSVRPTAGRPRLDAAALGRGRRVRSGRLHDRDVPDALRTRIGDLAGRHRRERRATSTSLLELAERAGRRGRRRRSGVAVPSTADADAKPTGRRKSTMPLIEIARAETDGRGDGRAGALEGTASGCLASCWSRPTCWSTRCAAAAAPGRGSGSTCSTYPGDTGRRRSRWRSTSTRGRGSARPGRRKIRYPGSVRRVPCSCWCRWS